MLNVRGSWAQLTGHYVNYRKQVSPSLDSLLPQMEFRLYAVAHEYSQSRHERPVSIEEGAHVWQ
jgi:hypothetical protein